MITTTSHDQNEAQIMILQIETMWDGRKTHNARVAAWENVKDAIRLTED